MPIKAAVMGLGNIGRYAIEALEIQPDFTCVGVIRRKESLGKDAHDLRGVPEYASLADLEAVSGKPDVVLLCAPSRKIPEVAGDLLGRGYNTVDSFDIHDRVNYSVKKSVLKINEEHTLIKLKLSVDTKYGSVMDYFEIFMGRMILCRKAAERLGLQFKLMINEQQLI